MTNQKKKNTRRKKKKLKQKTNILGSTKNTFSHSGIIPNNSIWLNVERG